MPGIVKKIATGLRHTLILFHDGSIFCAGSNFYGQTGFSKDVREKPKFAPISFFCHFTDSTSSNSSNSETNDSNSSSGSEKETQIHTIHNNYIVKDIVCGSLFSLVLTKENFLYGFGDNLKKQLLDLEKEKIYTPTLISFDFLFSNQQLSLNLNNTAENNQNLAILPQKSVKQMIAGRHYIAVVDSNNELYWRGEIDKDNTTEGPKGFLNEKRLEALNVLRPELGNDIFLHPGYNSLFVQLLPKSSFEIEIKKGMLQFANYIKLTESIWDPQSKTKQTTSNQLKESFYAFEDVEIITVDRKIEQSSNSSFFVSTQSQSTSNLNSQIPQIPQTPQPINNNNNNNVINVSSNNISGGFSVVPAGMAQSINNLKKRTINQLLTIPQINMNAIGNLKPEASNSNLNAEELDIENKKRKL